MIIAVDPGNVKSGIAVTDDAGRPLERRIVPTEHIGAAIASMAARFGISSADAPVIVCGNGTNHAFVAAELRCAAEIFGAEVVLVEEGHSTEEARRRYFDYNPPAGLKRFIPSGMRMPPEPVDDITALILAERYIRILNERKGNG